MSARGEVSLFLGAIGILAWLAVVGFMLRHVTKGQEDDEPAGRS